MNYRTPLCGKRRVYYSPRNSLIFPPLFFSLEDSISKMKLFSRERYSGGDSNCSYKVRYRLKCITSKSSCGARPRVRVGVWPFNILAPRDKFRRLAKSPRRIHIYNPLRPRRVSSITRVSPASGKEK